MKQNQNTQPGTSDFAFNDFSFSMQINRDFIYGAKHSFYKEDTLCLNMISKDELISLISRNKELPCFVEMGKRVMFLNIKGVIKDTLQCQYHLRNKTYYDLPIPLNDITGVYLVKYVQRSICIE